MNFSNAQSNADQFCGGFCDDDDAVAEQRQEKAEAKRLKEAAQFAAHEPPVPDDCEICKKPLIDSFLWDTFRHPVCDSCRDRDGEHALITKTRAKDEYLLKDYDLDQRKPPLRFYRKKNDYGHHDMKLYLKCQVYERMNVVHGNFEEMEREKLRKQEESEQRKMRRFESAVKKMRKERKIANSSLPPLPSRHEHVFNKTYEEDQDRYREECGICGFITYSESL